MIEGLLEAIADYHRTRTDRDDSPSGTAIGAMADQVVAAIDSALSDASAAAERPPVIADLRPVVRHVPSIDPHQGDPRIDAVLAEFVAIADQLPWTQTAGYLDRLSRDYLDNYGYVRLVGPDSIIEHQTVVVGIGVWGPNLNYPLHEHPAEELYDVLHGCPEFATDTTEFVAHRPGSAIHHPPRMPHAQRFGSEVSALLYTWTGEVRTDATLID